MMAVVADVRDSGKDTPDPVMNHHRTTEDEHTRELAQSRALHHNVAEKG